ncbi:hypothetical protein JCM5350_007415 [Sporobolomyces pararoseus]
MNGETSTSRVPNDQLEFDPSLIDPLLLSPQTRQNLLDQQQLQDVSQQQQQQQPQQQPHEEGEGDIAVNHRDEEVEEEELDPSLRNLKDLFTQPQPQPHSRSTIYSVPSHSHFDLTTDRGAEGDEEDSDSNSTSEEEDDERGSDLESNPSDPTEQVNQLREMDERATKSLISNREYQEDLKTLMKRFELASKRTNQLKAFVKSLSVELLAGQEMKVFPPPNSIDPTLPWFKHFYGRDVPTNREGEERDLYLSQTRFWPWSQAEKNRLKEEVIAHNHRKIALEATEKGEDFAEKLASIDPDWFVSNTEGLDWETISLVIGRRKAMDCKVQWLQHDHPSLNFKKFSKPEMTKLIELVEIEKLDDWEEIAKVLGNGRVGWDCLKKYRNRSGQRIDWTKEQDQQLRDAIKTYGENWQIIARICGKHSNACINRWTKSLKPTITKGKWSLQEDESLKTAVALVGTHWKSVADRVRGRTDAQCRERWTNVLDPVLAKKKAWTKEEDEELLEAKACGKTWAEISRECLGAARTDNQCMRRWQDLQKKPKAKSKKGKKKRLPKDTDEEDNVVGGGDGDENEAVVGDDQPVQPPKKRAKRQVKQKNPELSAILAMELDEGEVGPVAQSGSQVEEEEVTNVENGGGASSGAAGGGGGGRATLRAGVDIMVDFNMFADDEERAQATGTSNATAEDAENEGAASGSKAKGGTRKRKATTSNSTVKSKRGGKKK